MNQFVSELYNFVTSTVVPVAIEQTSNLVGGAAQALTTMGQAALEWGSGSEDATASAEVFSWETSRGDVPDAQRAVVEEKKEVKEVKPTTPKKKEEQNTSYEWEVVQEDPEITGPVKHNQFEIVQNDYDWMKNSS